MTCIAALEPHVPIADGLTLTCLSYDAYWMALIQLAMMRRSCYERLLVAEQELCANSMQGCSGRQQVLPPASGCRALAAQRAARCMALMYMYASKQEVRRSSSAYKNGAAADAAAALPGP